jgi:hypothetical protein
MGKCKTVSSRDPNESRGRRTEGTYLGRLSRVALQACNFNPAISHTGVAKLDQARI